MNSHRFLTVSSFILILSSCGERKKDETPGYPFYHVSSSLFQDINHLATNGHLTIDNLNTLKNDRVKEFYVASSELKVESGECLISNETSILALITDGNGRFEIWQVSPFQTRIVQNVEGQKAIVPYPYGKKEENGSN